MKFSTVFFAITLLFALPAPLCFAIERWDAVLQKLRANAVADLGSDAKLVFASVTELAIDGTLSEDSIVKIRFERVTELPGPLWVPEVRDYSWTVTAGYTSKNLVKNSEAGGFLAWPSVESNYSFRLNFDDLLGLLGKNKRFPEVIKKLTFFVDSQADKHFESWAMTYDRTKWFGLHTKREVAILRDRDLLVSSAQTVEFFNECDSVLLRRTSF